MRRPEPGGDMWRLVAPLVRETSRAVPRVDDRRLINGMLRRFRTAFRT